MGVGASHLGGSGENIKLVLYPLGEPCISRRKKANDPHQNLASLETARNSNERFIRLALACLQRYSASDQAQRANA
jgi:hypothetical protein